jgi:CheY-like chemotaxis protein
MRYYLLVNRRPEGPFEVDELFARPDFGAESMVCPVGETSADAWRRAKHVPELYEAPAAQDALPVEAEPAAEEAPVVDPAAAEASAGLESAVVPEAEGGAEPLVEELQTDAAAESVEPAEAPTLDALAADEPHARDDNPARRLIMVVDDESEFRTLLAAAIKAEGFRTVAASDGKDATGKLQPFTPDLIITDLMMPRQGGYEFIRGLQSLGFGDIPVVVVTGFALDPTTVASMRMEGNIVEFFTKPMNMGVLLTLIHDKLGTKRLSPRQKLEKENDDGWSSAA